MGLRLMAELGLDGSGFEAGIRKAEGAVRGIGAGLKGLVVGAVGVYTIEQAFAKTVETAKELVETSERLSIAPEQLQVLREAAKQSGVEMERLSTTFERLEIARQKALGGGAEGADALRAFRAAGVSEGALKSQTAPQLFMGPLRSAALEHNAADLAPAFREILGKGFGEIVPVLKTDFGELEEKMKSIGAIMDTETAVKLKHLGDEFSLMGQILTSRLGPALIHFAEGLYGAILNLGKWVAGLAGAAGASTSKMGIKDVPKASLGMLGANVKALWGLVRGKGIDQVATEWGGQMEGTGFDMNAAIGAKSESEAPWVAAQKQFADFLQKLKDEAAKLDHPIPAAADHAGLLGGKVAKKALETPTDSLVKIGNFLGGNSNMHMLSLQERTARATEKVAKNTTPRGNTGGQVGREKLSGHAACYPAA